MSLPVETALKSPRWNLCCFQKHNNTNEMFSICFPDLIMSLESGCGTAQPAVGSFQCPKTSTFAPAKFHGIALDDIQEHLSLLMLCYFIHAFHLFIVK